MEEIKIVSRWESTKILVSGKYESIKECVEKNKANLSGAYLSRADLSGANLFRADLSRANLSEAYLFGADLFRADLSRAYLFGANLSEAYLFGANLSGANLSGANLSGANLSGANLSGANLFGANLFGANLSGAEGYVNSHDFWIEIIRRQKTEYFTEKEWSIIGVVAVHRICWDSILKRYGKKIMPIFKKLEKAGFGEWAEFYEKKLKVT